MQMAYSWMWMSSQSMTVHLLVKINSKMSIIFFILPLSKMWTGSQRNIVPVNYVHEFLACIIGGVHWHGTPRSNKSLVDEVTTLWRHLEANHSVSDFSLSYAVLEHFHLLGEVSKLGKECQFLVETTWRYQEAQGGCGGGNSYSGPWS